MCEETFRARFHLPLYSFIEWLLARYRLVPTQVHPNVWKVIFSFMIKCAKVGLEHKIRVLRSILALKAGRSSKSMVYASYRSSALTSLIFESFHRWGDNFFFILSKAKL